MTINIMFFIVLAVAFFDFRTLTPIMIIVLALLDEVPVGTRVVAGQSCLNCASAT